MLLWFTIVCLVSAMPVAAAAVTTEGTLRDEVGENGKKVVAEPCTGLCKKLTKTRMWNHLPQCCQAGEDLALFAAEAHHWQRA